MCLNAVISKSGGTIGCCEQTCSVEVSNRRNLSNEWVTKPSTDKQCFFRENIPATVIQIQNVYNRCRIGTIQGAAEVCVRNYYANDGNNQYYLQFLLDGQRNIVSAYPVNRQSTLSCSRLLDYGNRNYCPPWPAAGWTTVFRCNYMLQHFCIFLRCCIWWIASVD